MAESEHDEGVGRSVVHTGAEIGSIADTNENPAYCQGRTEEHDAREHGIRHVHAARLYICIVHGLSAPCRALRGRAARHEARKTGTDQ